MPLRTKPIPELIGTWNDRDLGVVIDLCNAMKAIANYPDLCGKLGRIVHLLKIAAAAGAEVFARRFDAMFRRLQDLDYLGKRSFTFDLVQDERAAKSPAAASETKTVNSSANARPKPRGTIFSIRTSS